MSPHWKALVDLATLDAVDGSSCPVVIFKHSTRCNISDVARGRLERGWGRLADRADFYYLDLIAYRPVSNDIAERYHVAHESPQILLIVGGECVYEASHLAIMIDDIEEQLSLAQA
jgi:bacillithiol system protein YtxJ